MENKHTDTPRLLLTTAEAARAMGVSRDTLYTLLWRQGPEGVRSVKAGKRRLIPVRELERWIKDQLGEDDAPPAA
jgi:excisionase family DNA binding protein